MNVLTLFAILAAYFVGRLHTSKGDRMNMIEDFKNAPIGATATHADGRRAMKMGVAGQSWITPYARYVPDEQMEGLGYTLDPTGQEESE